MFLRSRIALAATLSALALGAVGVPSAQASLFSLLPGSCSAPESQPFAAYADYNNYVLVPGGTFQSGGTPWTLTGGAQVSSGALFLPTGSTATSPASCTSIYQPTLRMFVRNTGSASSRLKVEALYPGLLGSVRTATLGYLPGTSSWAPSPAMSLLVNDLLATVSLAQTAIAFRFIPADSTGNWSITDVYVDPYFRG